MRKSLLIMISLVLLLPTFATAHTKRELKVEGANMSGAPVQSTPVGEIEVGQLYEQVSIASYGTQTWYLRVPAHGSYKFSLTRLQSDIGALIYNEDFSTDIDCDEFQDNTDEACEGELEPGQLYYVMIDEYDRVASSYDLQVSRILR